MKLPVLMTIRAIFTVIILVLFFSCITRIEQSNTSGEIHIVIDPNNLPEMAKLSELVKSVRLIPLETNSSCLIGSTGKISFGKNHILVQVMDGESELFHFNPEGKFLNKIGRKGKGPGEYTNVRGITAFEDSLFVYVGMSSKRKINKYSFDGNFIQEINYGKGLYYAKVLDYNRIAFNCYNDFEVKIVNTLSNDTVSYIRSGNEARILMKQFTGNPQTGFFYTALGRDTIWKIEMDSMRPAITFDFGSGHFTAEEFLNSLMDAGGYPAGKLSIGGSTFFGKGYFHFSLLREDHLKEYTYCHVIVDEKTKKTWHLDQSPESDDILFCTSTDFRTNAYSGEWVSVVGAYELIDAFEQIKANSDFNYPEKLIEQINNMTIEDNPVLVLYTLK